MKNITVFGGSGYLASALLPRLKGNITIVARNEGKLVEMKQKFPNINIITGDISDKWIVKKAMQNADEIYVLAAVKGVDIAEIDTYECCNTNIVGLMNILKESYLVSPDLLAFISTDKVGQVKGVYGASKLIGEALVREAQSINPSTKYRVVRYGNVWASTGSFITKWIPAIKRGEGIKITDPEMTRFFFLADEAVSLIYEAVEKADGAKPYIPSMKSMKIGDVVDALKLVFGEFNVEIIGNRGAENQHETMDGIVFSNQVEMYSIDEIKNKFIIPVIDKFN